MSDTKKANGDTSGDQDEDGAGSGGMVEDKDAGGTAT